MKKRILSLLCCLAISLTLLPVNVAAAENTVEFGGEVYDLIQGYHYAPSNEGSSFETYLPFFYSDGYFEEDPTEYNEHLATMSMNVATASNRHFDARSIFRHGPVRQLLIDIGCDEDKIFVNDSNLVSGECYSIGYTLGQKELAYHSGEKTGYTLIPIVPRSAGYELEWVSNFDIGTDGEPRGFSLAADEVMLGIENYLETYGLTDDAAAGRVKFWPAGHSRGGAVASLVAKRLVDLYGTASVYCYTWEAPASGFGSNDAKYNCIHNCVNYADLVTLAVPETMGFFRYGQDHVYPSADASEYARQKSAMLEQFVQIDPTYQFSDDFELAYITVSLSLLNILSTVQAIQNGEYVAPVSYSNTDSVNRFAGDYMRTLVAKLVQRGIISREQLNKTVTISLDGCDCISTQQALLNLVEVYYSMSAATEEAFLEKIKTFSLEPYLDTITDLKNILENWNSLSNFKKKSYIAEYWEKLEATGALHVDGITPAQQIKIKEAWPAVCCVILPLLSYDYNTRAYAYGYRWVSNTRVLLGTLLNNIQLIPANHIQSVTLAWARSFDSYYAGVPSYRDDDHAPVGVPSASINGCGVSGDISQPGSMELSDVIKLDVADRSGETYIYTLKNITKNQTITENQLYTNGIRLPETSCSPGLYSLSVTVWSYGKENSSTFYFTLAPSCCITAVGASDGKINCRLICNNALSGPVQIVAAAYNGSQLISSAVSDSLTASPETALEIALPIPTAAAYSYRLFLVSAGTYVPLSPCCELSSVAGT